MDEVLASLQRGQIQLRKVPAPGTAPSAGDLRSNLMTAIRQGVTLKKVRASRSMGELFLRVSCGQSLGLQSVVQVMGSHSLRITLVVVAITEGQGLCCEQCDLRVVVCGTYTHIYMVIWFYYRCLYCGFIAFVIVFLLSILS